MLINALYNQCARCTNVSVQCVLLEQNLEKSGQAGDRPTLTCMWCREKMLSTGPWIFVQIMCASNAKPIPSSTLTRKLCRRLRYNSKKSAGRLLLLLLFLMSEIKCFLFRNVCSATSAAGIYSLPRSTEHQWAQHDAQHRRHLVHFSQFVYKRGAFGFDD